MSEERWDDIQRSEQRTKVKRGQFNEHDLEELREHIDLVSYNIGKVYRHAKERTRKECNQAKHTLRRKLRHSYKNDKS